MKIKARHIFQIIGLLLIVYFIKSINFNISTLTLIKEPLYIPLSIGLYMIFFPISAIRMTYFLKSVGNESDDIKTLTKIEFISKYIYNITPSKMYLPAKAILLNRICHTRKSISAAIISFEYGLDSIITTLMALCGFLLLFRELLNVSLNEITVLLITIITAFIICISLPGTVIDRLSARASKISNKTIKKIAVGITESGKIARKTWRELALNRKMRYILPITILQIAIMAISTKVLFFSMSTDVPILWIIAVNTSILFIGGISQIPGGIGVREIAGTILYSSLGIQKETTQIVVLISRLFTIIPLTIGWYYSTNINIRPKKDKH